MPIGPVGTWRTGVLAPPAISQRLLFHGQIRGAVRFSPRDRPAPIHTGNPAPASTGAAGPQCPSSEGLELAVAGGRTAFAPDRDVARSTTIPSGSSRRGLDLGREYNCSPFGDSRLIDHIPSSQTQAYIVPSSTLVGGRGGGRSPSAYVLHLPRCPRLTPAKCGGPGRWKPERPRPAFPLLAGSQGPLSLPQIAR